MTNNSENFQQKMNKVVVDRMDFDGGKIEVSLGDAADSDQTLKKFLQMYTDYSSLSLKDKDRQDRLNNLNTELDKEINDRAAAGKRTVELEALSQMIDGERESLSDPVRLVEKSVALFHKEINEKITNNEKIDPGWFVAQSDRISKLITASSQLISPDRIGLEESVLQTQILDNIKISLNDAKNEFLKQWRERQTITYSVVQTFVEKKAQLQESLVSGAASDKLTQQTIELINATQAVRQNTEIQALPDEFKNVVLSLLDIEELKINVVNKWKVEIDSDWNPRKSEYKSRFIDGTEVISDTIIQQLESGLDAAKTQLNTQRAQLFDLQVEYFNSIIKEMESVLESLKDQKEQTEAQEAERLKSERKVLEDRIQAKEREITEYKRLEDLIRTAVSNFETYKIPPGVDAYDEADMRIRNEDGYFAQMKVIVDKNPELRVDFEEFEKLIIGKFDLHATWTAMRPAVEDEPRSMEKLPSRRSYDFTAREIDYFLNDSELNPERQCRTVTKEVLMLDGKYHNVTYKETPVAMVLSMIDDIFDGRIVVPIGSSGGVSPESEERFVNGRNYHKHEGLIFKALKQESMKLSGDGTKYSDDTIRTAFRMHVITTLGHSHQSVDTPGTGDEFTKGYLYKTYCGKYAQTGKDSFTPDMPYSLLSPDVDETMMATLSPEMRRDILRAREIFDSRFKKLPPKVQAEYQWVKKSLYEETPYKSAHKEFDIDGNLVEIPAHYGYTILPLMAWLTVGKFPNGKTMSFDLIREKGTEKRIWNLMPFVKRDSGPFKDVTPPDNNFMANYYADLKGTAMPLLRNVLMADPGKLMGVLSSPSEIGTIVKYIDDGWIWIRNVRDHDNSRRKQDKKKFRFLLARDLAKWAISSNMKKQTEVGDFLFRLEKKDISGEPFISHQDRQVIEELVINYWLELQQEFGDKAAQIVKHSG